MKRFAMIIVMMVTVVTSNASAGSRELRSNKMKEMTANLLVGIHSENEGLRKSAIYMAGKYKINEAVPVLALQLKKEENPDTRILIALSLYTIGSPVGIQAVKLQAAGEKNPRVKKMYTEIYESFEQMDVTEIKAKRFPIVKK